MTKKTILIFMCLILLSSCGRKNEVFEAYIENNNLDIKNIYNNFSSSKKNEIY